jgi:hypothetical protein
MKIFKNDGFHAQKILALSFVTVGLALGTSGHAQTLETLDGNIHLGEINSQSIGLGAKLEISVEVTADEASSVNLAIDSEDLAEQIQDGDISIQSNPPQISLGAGETKEVKLEIQTKTTAPSFDAKKFGLVVKSDKGSTLTSADISLTVLPLYVVTVIDGTDSDNPYDFDSQPGISYFRPHAKGLQFVFKNMSVKKLAPSKPVIIHGDGVIQHQDISKPLQHGEVYQPQVVHTSIGTDMPGYYTIHDVYHPDRSVVVNATKFSPTPPAPAPAPAADASAAAQ